MGFSWSDIGNLVGGATGGVTGAIAGKLGGDKLDQRKARQGDPRYGTVPKRFPNGISGYYDDSYGALLDYMKAQGGGAITGAYQNLLQNFQGDQDAFRGFLETASPFMASAALEGSPAFRATQQIGGLSNPMQAYGTAAGQIENRAQAAKSEGLQQLASQGLGRSAGRASLASRISASTGADRAGLFSGLYQRSLDDKRQDVARAFDAQRTVAQLALGQNPMPRQPGPQGADPLLALAGAGGNLLGMLGGAAIAKGG